MGPKRKAVRYSVIAALFNFRQDYFLLNMLNFLGLQ